MSELDKRDAERYQWLREHLTEIVWHDPAHCVGNVRQFRIGELDEVVDAAINKTDFYFKVYP